MKPGGGGPAARPESQPAAPPGPPLPGAGPADVRLCGHLRKQKSRRRRFFVLRADPPRLECYASEKKFRGGGARPELSVSLAGACTISKRVDARRRRLIVLYTRDRSLGVAAASEAEQQAWYSALLEVRAAAGEAQPRAGGRASHEDPGTWLLAPLQDVWPVTLRPKGLGRARGLGSGGYRLCLGSGILSLLREPRRREAEDAQASPPPALRLSLLSVRRCGHADSFFFLELGRSAPTGPGELWLQAPDAVVAQSIHETVLAAMKRLGDGAAGGRAEPRDPPSGASRPSVPPPYETLIAGGSNGLARGECLGERSKPATPRPGSTLGAAASYPEGLERGGGYIGMGAGSDYEPMGAGEAGGYMVMAPPGLRQAAANALPHQPLQELGGTEYVPMSHFPSGSFSSSSLPRSYKPGAGEPGPRRGVGGNWGPAGTQPCLQLPSELAGEYVCIEYTAPKYVGTGTAKPAPLDGRLNYIDLELVPPLEARGDAPGGSTLSYARIEFQKLREARNSCGFDADSQAGLSPHPHLQCLPCDANESK
ncbi:insulin receptor substrate 1-like [Talpa occidentalis]|uniref:insulin receptor substrate 1-like n=1 Tax=Talpa occidentalis TaxID=50954 RepID=UPI00189051D9|nr:insulin receptor substrate 1-like [Talpa occidentalis]